MKPSIPFFLALALAFGLSFVLACCQQLPDHFPVGPSMEQYIETLPAIVVVSNRDPVTGQYETPLCPRCNAKMISQCSKFICAEHHVSETKEVTLK